MSPSPRPAILLAWYDGFRRDLPWRRTRDPWAVWVSEVMLQQTQVATAAPYFVRFLDRFPNPAALAEASEEELLAFWSGLGYYRRARLLQSGARAVAARGEMPRRPEELLRLPGIGPYTAAAIASIAFGEPVPVLDGNVARVMARLEGIREPATSAPVRRRLRVAAAGWLDATRPGDSNQALMELGATLCRPRAPRCASCPLSAALRGPRQRRDRVDSAAPSPPRRANRHLERRGDPRSRGAAALRPSLRRGAVPGRSVGASDGGGGEDAGGGGGARRTLRR